jgi:phenylalanyl-tRNA synthetase beta chain
VIADARQIESLAGIMGGDATAVTDDTQNVYIEAAFWWPKAIAGRSRRYNFSTDAGHRFERGVDPQHTVEHIERITALVQAICGGVAGPISDVQTALPAVRPVTLRIARATRVIGMPLTQTQCADALARLGLPLVQDEANGTLTVTPPSYRFDITIEEDLIEEVARMVGYNHLPTTPPLAPITPKLRAENQRSSFAVRRQLAALGYQETINFSFVDERWEHELAGNAQPIKLLNPIASQMGVMRSSLLGSLLQVLKFNLDRRADSVRVFELGRAFLRDASVRNTDTTVEGFDQPMRVAGLACGPADQLQWGRKEQGVDFFDVKGDVEALLAPLQAQFEPATHPAMHPGRCARVLLNGRAIGFIGELHPQWRQSWELPLAPVMFELELDAVLQRTVPLFKTVPKHQSVERDLAVVVPESVTYAQVLAAVNAALPATLLRKTVLFDVYRAKPVKVGEAAPSTGLAVGEKSLAVRLTLGRDDASLTDADIDAALQAVIAQVTAQTGARLRV